MLTLREPNLIDIALCAANLIPEDRDQWQELTGQPYDPSAVASECWGYAGPKWAICAEDGLPLAVAGCRLMRPHVYQSWFLSGPELWTHGGEITALTRNVMMRVLHGTDGHPGANRIETLCLADRCKTRAWYEQVGLHLEAEFKQYGTSGRDFVQYTVHRG